MLFSRSQAKRADHCQLSSALSTPLMNTNSITLRYSSLSYYSDSYIATYGTAQRQRHACLLFILE